MINLVANGNGGLFPYFLEPLVGFEPTTPRLQITCSGQLRGGKAICIAPLQPTTLAAIKPWGIRRELAVQDFPVLRLQRYELFLFVPNISAYFFAIFILWFVFVLRFSCLCDFVVFISLLSTLVCSYDRECVCNVDNLCSCTSVRSIFCKTSSVSLFFHKFAR